MSLLMLWIMKGFFEVFEKNDCSMCFKSDNAHMINRQFPEIIPAVCGGTQHPLQRKRQP